MNRAPNFVNYVMTTAVLICLGWGLRGYIGGGPLGAMIPGAFLALWLCLLLGIEGRRAALIAAFGAVGIGFGGEMTYGQTLGFLRSDDTVLWGLLGTVVKGGVWGLLGGAAFGLAFVVQRLSARQLALALLAFLAAIVVGIALVNQPKLIYFSDPINKPRNEVWAGLLLGAVVLLGMIRGAGPLPLRFALYGAVGGAVGFGVGGVLMAIGYRLEPPFRGLPWWKFMEFTFGACLGAAYGFCALRYRDDLLQSGEESSGGAAGPRVPWAAIGGVLVFIGIALVAWNNTAEGLIELAAGLTPKAIVMPLVLVVLGYTTLGVVLMLLAARSETLAWHTAITMTFLATIIDLQDDLGPESGIEASALLRWGLVLVALLLCAALTVAWQRNPRRELGTLLLGLMWACTGVAFTRILVSPPVMLPTPEQIAAHGGLVARYLHALVDHGIVHGIFAACTVYGTVALFRARGAGAAG